MNTEQKEKLCEALAEGIHDPAPFAPPNFTHIEAQAWAFGAKDGYCSRDGELERAKKFLQIADNDLKGWRETAAEQKQEIDRLTQEKGELVEALKGWLDADRLWLQRGNTIETRALANNAAIHSQALIAKHSAKGDQ